MGRRATRYDHRDANESPLLKAAREMGVTIERAPPLDNWGWFPKLVQWIPIEVKNPDGKNRFERSQKDFMRRCDLTGAPYFVWRTIDDVVRDCNLRTLRREHAAV